MQNRVAIIGIIVEDNTYIEELNNLLHKYSHIIVGRMGIPYRDRNIGVISIIVDAPSDEINTLSGKLGMIKGINSKTMYAKVADKHE
ncbi:TM1266 family iron-only hydrogenase system putative regulator [Peptoanaerobacter stomatis]|jgi:putative iron-only hydrogenase system regulator